jgi:hypothetical protein
VIRNNNDFQRYDYLINPGENPDCKYCQIFKKAPLGFLTQRRLWSIYGSLAVVAFRL